MLIFRKGFSVNKSVKLPIPLLVLYIDFGDGYNLHEVGQFYYRKCQDLRKGFWKIKSQKNYKQENQMKPQDVIFGISRYWKDTNVIDNT